jgi:hypothetical protein
MDIHYLSAKRSFGGVHDSANTWVSRIWQMGYCPEFKLVDVQYYLDYDRGIIRSDHN